MKINQILTLAAAVLLASCQPQTEEKTSSDERSDRSKMMIANMKLASDPHSYSKPNEARVTHLDWDATVDFDQKKIDATATYAIENKTGTSSILFDIHGLQIKGVKVDGELTEFQIGESRDFLGEPLEIPIKPESKQVSITYETAPGAEALLWVEGESPFLFTQSQAILARTWLPCQDSPGVRYSYNARVKVPSNLMALMSAENPQQKTADGVYTFTMEQPIPSYLMALAVGDVEFRAIGDRSGVYAIPELIDAAENEFQEMDDMLVAAEGLYGSYVWGRYDLLILPPAFPFGGMENPRLTFATPTIIAGDRSLVALVAHELAHSWSGNLVTNSTWDDFWLNEGFTVYFEQRIMEAVYGREHSEMLAKLTKQELIEEERDIREVQNLPNDTKLKLNLIDRNPDDGLTAIPYNKGYFFLRLIEETVGREKFDQFLKSYFTEHSFQVMDTDNFLSYLNERLLTDEDRAAINIDAWVFGVGIPENIPNVDSDRLEHVDAIVEAYANGTTSVADIPWDTWEYQEKYRFISELPESVTAANMAELDAAYHILDTGNNEVLFAWLEKSIRKDYAAAYPRAESFLISVGRRKFLTPLYRAMKETNKIDMALAIYAKARPHYHAVATATMDALLEVEH
ncbi:MAG: M1 family metallopeptidase [Flavobacteriales bacterium]|nr:M1 family metallopeptidase [Flavobacteriales bacterium]